MKLRGFGDVLGYQQSGIKNFKFANPVIHEDLFLLAERYIKKNSIDVNESKYTFLLKLPAIQHSVKILIYCLMKMRAIPTY
mgnify:CR=1 FL=1